MRLGFALLATTLLSSVAFAQVAPPAAADRGTAQAAPAGDIPAKFTPPTAELRL